MKELKQVRRRLAAVLGGDGAYVEMQQLQNENARLRQSVNAHKKQVKSLRRARLALDNPDPEQSRVHTFESLLKPLSGERLLDLGCGHGKFAVAAADLGWKVTGVDARSERWPGDGRVQWVCFDVREYPLEGFDVISVLGLLYHLDQPSQLELLKRCAASGAVLTILETHVGLKQRDEEGGYRGQYYKEPGLATSSWGNEVSFWPTEECLIKMARDAGFSLISPVHPPREKHRTFYVCYP